MLLFIDVFWHFADLICGISIHLMLLFISTTDSTPSCVSWFQYISCYCLSQKAPYKTVQAVDFNTSHVTVYRAFQHFFWFNAVYFNTSHVTVYRKSFGVQDPGSIISIHLMLLFIIFNTYEIRRTITISIHLMLLFIRKRNLQQQI